MVGMIMEDKDRVIALGQESYVKRICRAHTHIYRIFVLGRVTPMTSPPIVLVYNFHTHIRSLFFYQKIKPDLSFKINTICLTYCYLFKLF